MITTARDERAAALLLAPAPLPSAYEMRTLRTDAERDEAVALVQDRQRWLTMRGLPVPARADIPAFFRDLRTQPAGLFEDGLSLACMIPQRDPDLGWGGGAVPLADGPRAEEAAAR